MRRYAGVDHRGRERRRRRRFVGSPAPRPRRPRARATSARASSRSPTTTRAVVGGAFEHRFDGGELAGHALGNLMLVGLAESLGDFTAALDEAGRLLGAVGRVLPATTEPVVLKADVGRREPSRARSRCRTARAGSAASSSCPATRRHARRGRGDRPRRPGRARAGLAVHRACCPSSACPSSAPR